MATGRLRVLHVSRETPPGGLPPTERGVPNPHWRPAWLLACPSSASDVLSNAGGPSGGVSGAVSSFLGSLVLPETPHAADAMFHVKHDGPLVGSIFVPNVRFT